MVTYDRSVCAISFANDILRQGIANVKPIVLSGLIFELRDCLINEQKGKSVDEPDKAALDELTAEIHRSMDWLDGPGGQFLFPGKPTREQYARHAASGIYWSLNYRTRVAAIQEVVEFIYNENWRQAASIHDHVPLPEPSVAVIAMRIEDHFKLRRD